MHYRSIFCAFACVLASAACSSPPPGPPTADQVAAAHLDIDAYIDLRDDAPADATATLVDRLIKQGFAASDVEAILSSGRASYPAPGVPVNGYTKLTIDCYNVVYSSTYYLMVPTTYDATKPTSLVIIGHGGNSSMTVEDAESTAYSYIQAYRKLSADAGGPQAILAAPATTVGWSPIGDSLIESTISELIRAYNIDPNRIYLVGQSMGGHLAWRSAITYGDRFAAFSPESGGYTSFIDNHQIQNLYTTHGYTTFGSVEPYDLTATNLALGDWLTTNHFDWKIVEKDPGGHEIYVNEMDNIGAFFVAHPRDLYRTDTYYDASGAMQYTANWEGQDYMLLTAHPLMSNFHHWIEVTPRPDLTDRLTFYAQNLGDNHLAITSNNVRHLRVLLHPSMGIDLHKPVTITINGQVAFNAVPTVDLGQLLDRVREHDDRARVYYSAIDLDVTTDMPVADPMGAP